MDVIDRYLSAVRILLPASQADDIVAELRDGLLARREDRAAELGRPLTPAEDEQLLQAFGHPLVVAARYGRQGYLVGPELFPAYVFALKVVLAIVFAAGVAAGLIWALAPDKAIGAAAGRAAMGSWNRAFVAVGLLTIVFALLQRSYPRLTFLNTWRARDLPRRPHLSFARPANWFDHLAAIVAQSIFILWWIGAIHFWAPSIPLGDGQGLRLDLAPIWRTLHWPVLVMAVAVIAIHGLRLSRLARPIVWLRLDFVLRLAVIALAGVALRAGHWIDVSGAGLGGPAMTKVGRGVDMAMETALIVVVCVALSRAAYDLWKLYWPGAPANGDGRSKALAGRR